MARRDRCKIGVIYLPTTPRKPYGRRTARLLDTDLQRAGVDVLTARELRSHRRDTDTDTDTLEYVPVSMPCGGSRWHVYCPGCRRAVSRLYDLRRTALAGLMCRHCLGVRYATAYTLRRAEADRARVAEVERRAQRTHNAEARRRRQTRADALHTLRIDRAMAFDDRKGDAQLLGMLPALGRARAQERRAWEQAIRAVFQMRADRERAVLGLLAVAERGSGLWADRPGSARREWGDALLAWAREADRLDAAVAAAMLATPVEALPSSVLDEEVLAAWRARYRAQTQPRRRRAA